MASARPPVELRFPTGRMVGGSLYKGSDLDDKNVQLVFKTGPNAGQPRTDYSVALAIKKTQAHWANEPGWGQAIWAEGHAAWPQGQAQRPDFSWKIIDGDSQMPNKKLKKPCDQQGYPGHWVIWFSTSQLKGAATLPFKTAIMLQGVHQAAEWLMDRDAINPGDYIEVRGTVGSNESTQTAGVYLNANGICLRGYGERIGQSFNLAAAGFGADPLPAGASTTPVFTPAAGTPPAPGGAASPPPAYTPPSAPVTSAPPAGTASPPAAPAPNVGAGSTLPPNMNFVAAGGAGVQMPGAGAPPVPPAPPAPPAAAPAEPQKTAAWPWPTFTYAQMIGAGWTEEVLRQNGYIV